jgi:hypothetical protein
VQEWRTWRPENTRERLDIEDIGAVEVHYDIRSVVGELVTFETHFRFANDDIVVVPNTIRFINQTEVATFLKAAGFIEISWYGDWRRSNLTHTSPEIIALAS